MAARKRGGWPWQINATCFLIFLFALLTMLGGCGPSNHAPVALITANPTSGEAPLEVSFNASQSHDKDGKITTYKWDFGDGETGQGLTVTHTYSSQGTYVARLIVTDNEGATGSASVTIAVSPPNSGNHRPVARISPDTTETVAGTQVTLFGATFLFGVRNEQLNQTVQALNKGEIPNVLKDKYSFSQEALVTVVKANEEWRITDQKRKQDPKVFIMQLVAGTLNIYGSVNQDLDGNPLSYRWSQVAGPPTILAPPIDEKGHPLLKKRVFTPCVAGTYTIRLVVNDGKVDSEPVDVTITIKEKSAPIIQSFTYNRQEAIKYAEEWCVDKDDPKHKPRRNPRYDDLSNKGGDCANFVSQCLIAGKLNLSGYPGATGKGGTITSCTSLQKYLVNYLGAKCETRDTQKGKPTWFKPGDIVIFHTLKHAVFAVEDGNHQLVYDDHFLKKGNYHKNIEWYHDRGWNYCTYYHIPTPTVTITSPADSSTFNTGDTITFQGSAIDREDAPLTGASLVWTSNIDGQIGTGKSFSTSTLSVGTHVITLAATDSWKATGTTSVTITVKGTPSPNQPPTVTITSPVDGSTFNTGDTITFQGSATDPEDGPLSASLIWTSSIDGQIGTGESFTRSDLSVGTHTITLTATDSQGAKGTASVTITVRAKISAPPVMCEQVATFRGCAGLTGNVNSVAFSPDGKLLASAASCFDPRDDRVMVWNVKSKEPITTLHDEGVYAVSFSPDGKLLATGTVTGTVKLWDLESRECIATLHHVDEVYSVSFSPDGKLLATAGSSDKMIDIWDVRKKERIVTLTGEESTKIPSPVSICFSPDGKLLASGSGDIKLWDVEKRKCIATLMQDAGAVNSIAFSPDGRLLAAGAWEGEVQLWDVEKRQRVATLHHECEAENLSFIDSVAFSPDGRLLATTFQDEIDVWDVEKRQRVATLTGHIDIVDSVAFSPDGSLLAGGSWDTTISLWRVHKGTGGEIHVPEDYPTIQEAIYAANEGATIYVEAGTYLDNLDIEKSLTLRGAGWERTRIKAYTGGIWSYVVGIAAKRPIKVVIEGFTIDGAEDGIVVGGQAEVTVRNNKISENYKTNIFIKDLSRVIIENNLISAAGIPGGDGILITDEATATIKGNEIFGNTGNGIRVLSGQATIMDNVIRDNRHCGIDAASTSIVSCYGNEVYNNGSAGGFRSGDYCGGAEGKCR